MSIQDDSQYLGKVSCPICRKIYSTKGYASHYFANHDPVGIEKMKAVRERGTDATFRNKDFLQEKFSNIKKKVRTPKKCKNEDCQNQTTNTFCSRSCSCRHHNKSRTAESREKQKRSLRKSLDERPKVIKKKQEIKIKTRICELCGKIDSMIGRGRFRSTLCSSCNPSLAYRSACSFKFDLRNYPEEFNLNLLEEHGMFHPIKNPKGVSRDHMVSIRFGKDNNIDPRIISHPANCELLLHSDNFKKFSDCSITMEQLMSRIKDWETKYQ